MVVKYGDNKRNCQKLTTAQMGFLRSLSGVTRRDKNRNVNIQEKSHVRDINEKIKFYQQKWFQHLSRMPKKTIS